MEGTSLGPWEVVTVMVVVSCRESFTQSKGGAQALAQTGGREGVCMNEGQGPAALGEAGEELCAQL